MDTSLTPADRPSASELLLSHAPRLRRLARALVGDETSADDIVQETWLVAASRSHDGAERSLGWLRGVLRNRARERRREEHRRRRREERAARAERVSAECGLALERAELQLQLVEFVLALPPKYRDVIVLRYFEAMSTRAIAEAEGVPIDTVHTRLRRGIAILRNRLDRECGGRSMWASVLVPGGSGSGWAMGGSEGATSRSAGETASTFASAPESTAMAGWMLGGVALTAKNTTAAGMAVLLLGVVAWWAYDRTDGPDPTRISPPIDDPVVSTAPVETIDRATGPAEVSEAVTLEPPEPTETGTLRGVVVDLAGNPLPAIRVTAARVTDSDFMRFDAEVESETESAADGAFEFAAVPVGAYVVRAIGPERIPNEVRDLVIAEGEVTEVELALQRGLGLSGVVVDPYGQPVEGADVRSTTALSGNGLPSMLALRSTNDGWAWDRLAERTGADGRFELTRLPSGNRRIVARHPAWAPAELNSIAAGSRGLIIRLAQGGGVAGRVTTAGGEPVDGARVKVHYERERFWDKRMRSNLVAVTDSDGRWEILRLAGGPALVSVEADGFPRYESDTFEIDEASRDPFRVDAVLAESGLVRGRIVDSDGEAIADANVSISPTRGNPGDVRAKTDPEGKFELLGAVGAEYSFRARKDGYLRPQSSSVTLTSGVLDLGSIELARGFVIAGSVTDSTGAPLVGARVGLQRYFGERTGSAQHTRTDDAGEFSFRGRREGRYRVVVTGERILEQARELEVAGDVDDVSIVVESGAITGRVVDARGAPIGLARVEARIRYGDEAWVISDSDGTFTFHGAGDAEYKLNAIARGSSSPAVKARAGERVELRVTRKASLSGVVRDAETGEPIREFSVHLDRVHSRRAYRSGTRFSDPEGHFALLDRDPKEYRLRVYAPGYAISTLEVNLGDDVESHFEIDLERGAFVAGTLVGTDGRPVAGASIYLISEDEVGAEEHAPTTMMMTTGIDRTRRLIRRQHSRQGSATSDESGAFRLVGVPAGTVFFRVRHDEYLTYDSKKIDVTLRGVDVGRVTIDAGTRFSGVVYDDKEQPVRGGTVEIHPLASDGSPPPAAYAAIQRDGSWRRSGFLPGRYRVFPSGRDDLALEFDCEGAESQEVDFVLRGVTRETSGVLSPR